MYVKSAIQSDYLSTHKPFCLCGNINSSKKDKPVLVYDKSKSFDFFPQVTEDKDKSK